MKRSDQHKIDTAYRQHFEGFSSSPSSEVWNGLEQRLLQRKKDRRKVRQVISTIVILCMLCLAVAGIGRLSESKSAAAPVASRHTAEKMRSERASAVDQINSGAPVSDAVPAADRKISDDAPALRKNKLNVANTLVAGHSGDRSETTPETASAGMPKAPQKSFSTERPADAQAEKDITRLDALPAFLPLHKRILTRKLIAPTAVPVIFYKKNKPFLHRWSIAPWFGIDQYSRTLKENPEFTSGTHNVAFFEGLEHSSRNWSAGITLAFDLGKNWRIESGISRQEFRMKIEGYDFQSVYDSQQPAEAFLFSSFNTNRFRFEVEDPEGLEDGNLLQFSGNFSQRIGIISVPLSVAYALQKGRLGISLAAGLNVNFIQTNSHLSADGQLSGLKNVRQVFAERSGMSFLGYQGSINAYYRLDAWHSLFIGPQFSGAITPANRQKPVEFFPKRWGLRLGFEKHF